MITGKDLINEYQKMYSENEEIQEEKLYSTGDDYLDELLERAFCEGYEYAQKEYSLKDELKEAIKKGDEKKIKELKKKSIGRKAAAGAIIGGSTGGILSNSFYKKHKSDVIDHMKGKTSVNLNDDKTYNLVKNSASGIMAGGTGAVGAGIGAGIGRARFNRALKKAKKELENEK